jgi:UDP-glucose 4-epimerase
MNPRILVVGGAGYIGSHMVKRLGELQCEVTTLDSLVTGHRDAVLSGEFIEADVGDRALLDQLFASRRFDAVMHFASFIQVGESTVAPSKYYENNVSKTLTLLGAVAEAGIRNFIFSSTAATFGEPAYSPIDEQHPQQPINPYGRTKLMIEQALGDFQSAYGLRSVSLRYFNAAGADPQALLGERHEPETHLIPLVLRAASGRAQHISVFGRDYDTPDGTCIRDYVHIADLCEAHWLAVQRLLDGGNSGAFNLGNGDGFSVQQVIDTAKEVTAREIAVVDRPRRPGDPARLVADSTKARKELGWKPRYADLATIVRHAWRWEEKQTA